MENLSNLEFIWQKKERETYTYTLHTHKEKSVFSFYQCFSHFMCFVLQNDRKERKKKKIFEEKRFNHIHDKDKQRINEKKI